MPNFRARLTRLTVLYSNTGSPSRPKSPTSTDTMLGIEIADDARGGVRVVSADGGRGLRTGDVIVEVHGRAIGSVTELRTEMKKHADAEAVLFKVRRGPRHQYVGVPVRR
jgi:S1-C subfamily serine protease